MGYSLWTRSDRAAPADSMELALASIYWANYYSTEDKKDYHCLSSLDSSDQKLSIIVGFIWPETVFHSCLVLEFHSYLLKMMVKRILPILVCWLLILPSPADQKPSPADQKPSPADQKPSPVKIEGNPCKQFEGNACLWCIPVNNECRCKIVCYF